MQQYYYYHFERGNRTELESKTGLPFPDYEAIENRHFLNGPSFNGDFKMEYTIKLDTTSIPDFYQKIDQKIKEVDNDTIDSGIFYWNFGEDGKYYFSCFDDPQDEDDQTLELYIDKKNSQIKISFGRM